MLKLLVPGLNSPWPQPLAPIAPLNCLAVFFTSTTDQLTPPAEFAKLARGLSDSFTRPPTSISAARDALAADNLLTSLLGPDVVDNGLHTRKSEWLAFHTTGGDPLTKQVSEGEFQRYFELV